MAIGNSSNSNSNSSTRPKSGRNAPTLCRLGPGGRNLRSVLAAEARILGPGKIAMTKNQVNNLLRVHTLRKKLNNISAQRVYQFLQTRRTKKN